MTCVWTKSAIPCTEAHHLYFNNNDFFKLPKKSGKTSLPISNRIDNPTIHKNLPSISPFPSSSKVNSQSISGLVPINGLIVSTNIIPSSSKPQKHSVNGLSNSEIITITGPNSSGKITVTSSDQNKADELDDGEDNYTTIEPSETTTIYA